MRRAAAPPFVIPIFIAHQGCPHQCVFCNQYSITGRGRTDTVTALTVRREIEMGLARPRRNRYGQVQVAFYGGSFTGLADHEQEMLLGAVRPFLDEGRVDGIRLSTRPDYIGPAIIDFLKRHGVQVVELGIQSMDPVVLESSRRGHTVGDSMHAMGLLQKAGMQVGVQLMLGLPGERAGGVLSGARRVAELGPDFVRLYPLVVVRGSRLAELYEQGSYRPLSLNKAVALTAKMKGIFDRRHIPVIRMGLQPSASLEKELLAGPYHPAFGELVLSRLIFRRARKILFKSRPAPRKHLVLADRDQSLFRGPGNRNVKRLARLGLLENVELVFDPDQPRQSVHIV